jgi:hypothetical protein
MMASMYLKKLARLWFIWLNLSPAKTDLIARMSGVCALLYFPLVLHWSEAGREFLQLSPLRFGNHIIELPYPPQAWEVPLFFLHVVSCVYILFGGKRKIFFAIPACILAYHACLDTTVLSNAVWLTIFYLVALLFADAKPNSTRRIIQIVVTLCYAHATLNRLRYPDFMGGYSFQQWFAYGDVVKPEFAGLFTNPNIPSQAWAIFEQITAWFELAFAIGFWTRKTRKITVIVAALFHAVIYVVMIDTLMLFSGVMWTGLLAFVEEGKDWWSDEDRISGEIKTELAHAGAHNNARFTLRNSLATAFILFLCLFPLRILFWSGRTPLSISFADRLPLAYAMFLCREQTVNATIHYQDLDGVWHVESLVKRFHDYSSDNHLFAIAQYAFREHMDAKRVSVKISYLINRRWLQTKSLILERSQLGDPPAVISRTMPLVVPDHKNGQSGR